MENYCNFGDKKKKIPDEKKEISWRCSVAIEQLELKQQKCHCLVIPCLSNLYTPDTFIQTYKSVIDTYLVLHGLI